MATQTQIYTFQTQAEQTSLLYASLPDEWLEITLRLETAGPVAVGHLAELRPILSGRGRLLPVADDIIIKLSPSSRLYVASDTVDRVSVHINAIPGLEQILHALAPKSTSGGAGYMDIGRYGYTPKTKEGR